MSSCADVFIELLSTKNGAVGAVVNVCWQFKSGSWSEQSCFLELQQYARRSAYPVYLLTATKTNQEEEHCSESDWDLQTGFESLVYTWKKISTSVTQLYRSKWMSRWQAEQTCFLELPNIGCGECTCSQRRRRFKKRNIAEKVNGTCKQDFTCRNGLIAVPTVNKDFSCCETTQQKIQVPGVDREMCLKKEFYYCDSTLQKQGLSCSDGKEEDFKKESLLQLRPITRFQLQRCCRDVLTACGRKEIQHLFLDSSHETYIAVTVPHVAVLPVYGCVACCLADVSNVARARLWTEEDCQQRDWIQNTNPTTRRVFSTTRRVSFTTRRALYCKTSSNSKAPEHATQYKKCQFANLDVDTE
ncbi:hypothetical protein DPMN_081820 [Dreissena polymorpha]|uniref:Uncharacterized protein n=1 Tax=Dreissena polymorpha TaxID=45954 RepID=A0A9D3Y9M0_DREPO|nr:hypothetical protein DPMN_081820 [Dreissena polymorpha]